MNLGGRTHKYNVAPKELRTIDGVTFDSATEAYRYGELKLLERAGLISELVLQPSFEILPKFRAQGRTFSAVHYVADFAYVDDRGRRIIEDVKGVRTAVYSLKKKLFLCRYGHAGFDFREVPARR